MQPTLLHTLNRDLQNLLSDRLIETTLECLDHHPIYVLEHTTRGVKHRSRICLGADPKVSLFNLILRLGSQCDGREGFIEAFLEHHLEEVRLLAKRHLYNQDEQAWSVLKWYDEIIHRAPLTGDGPRLADVMEREIPNMVHCKHDHPTLCGMILATNEFGNQSLPDDSLLIKNAHQILYDYLTVEDLVRFINCPGEQNSCSLIPFNSGPIEYI